jgi:hypothetical protein
MQKLLFHVAELKRAAAYNARMGTIHEIKGDKMRVNMGLKHDGTPWLGPWIHTTDHRGGETQQEVYKVGQNVEMSALGADFSQASVAPHGPNETAPAPKHASEGNSTWQQGNTAMTRNEGSHNLMQGDGNDPDVNSRISKSGGASSFVKNGSAFNRTQVHKDGCTMSWKDDEHWVSVDKDGPLCDKPFMIKKHEFSSDNKAK